MKYTGKPYKLNVARSEAYARLSDLSGVRERIASLPDDLKAKMGTVDFPDSETLSFTAPGVGEMKFRIVERHEPECVRFLADTGVMPIYVNINLTATEDNVTDISAEIEAEIPLMVRPLIGGKLQEAADKFGEMFGMLNS